MRTISLKESAKLIRQELKAAFPEVKFCVRSDKNKDYVHVSWTDGPSQGQVRDITSKFAGTRWDNQLGRREYVSLIDENGEAFSYECDHVTDSRTYSPEFLTALANYLADVFQVAAPVLNADNWFSEYEGSIAGNLKLDTIRYALSFALIQDDKMCLKNTVTHPLPDWLRVAVREHQIYMVNNDDMSLLEWADMIDKLNA